jgi:hypothetical protein
MVLLAALGEPVRTGSLPLTAVPRELILRAVARLMS